MANVYEIITQQILSQLQSGTIPWKKPWRVIPPTNLVSRKQYRGINLILLNSLPFESPYFLTFKQARMLGGFVRQGEKGFPIIYWQFIVDEETEKKIPLLRYYTVFSLSQTVGIDAPPIVAQTFNPIEKCEEIVSGMVNRPKIELVGNVAAYFPSVDLVKLPARQWFSQPEEFYSTEFHELIHSTSHPSRLDRKMEEGPARFGSASYSKEELVAEIGASFLNAKAGISSATLENSSSYIANWLRVLRNDKKMIVCAAAQAHKSADYILGIHLLTNE